MKEDIKMCWIDALTSGEYKQCTGALKKGDGYCCLGVLNDLYRKETGDGRFGNMGFYTKHSESGSGLTRDVLKWSGVENYDGAYAEKSLMCDNDVRRKSFMEIAEIIFENF